MTTYFVLAHNYGQFVLWCQQKWLNRRRLIYLHDANHQVRGVRDYELIFLDGWEYRHIDRSTVDYIGGHAAHCHHESYDEPVVEDGEIVGWLSTIQGEEK